MTLEFLVQQVVSGLAMGCTYALIALGHVLIWNAMRILNFAHNEVVMIGAFLGLTFHVLLGLPYWLSVFLACACGSLFGVALRRSVYHYLRRLQASGENFLIASIGVSVFLINLATIIWGAFGFGFPDVFGGKPISLLGVRILPRSLWILGVGASLVLLLHWFLSRTKLGTGLRAVAQDKETASIMGVDVDAADALTFAIASALGAVAGVLLAPAFLVTTDMGQSVGLKAFAAAVAGGLDSLPGAVVGGLTVGVIENLSCALVSSKYKDAVAFVLLLLVLLVKPSGLFGKEGRRR